MILQPAPNCCEECSLLCIARGVLEHAKEPSGYYPFYFIFRNNVGASFGVELQQGNYYDRFLSHARPDSRPH